MTGSSALVWPAMAAAFLASLVEAVEALTIVLAVATVRGWRPAGLGAATGLVALVIIVVVLAALVAAPMPDLPLAAGVVLLFGCLGALLLNVVSAGRR